tara:strand:- start:3529 stop:4407 length:879 start_codon:yes stop_codon:yes gene_type:complete
MIELYDTKSRFNLVENKNISEYFNYLKKEYLKKGGTKQFFEAYANEGIFGFNENQPYFTKKKSILEIGCGGGLLSSYLHNMGYDITALDSHNRGFGNLYELANTVQELNKNFKIINSDLENFRPDRKYDFIFAVNVLEHVYDFRIFINKLMKLINPFGRIVIMCPNYSFPYEGHFNIPIIINKKLTYRIFSKHIKNKKIHMYWDPIECWNSLNWVNASDLKKALQKNNYNYSFDKMITKRLIDRVSYDNSFKERRGNLSSVIKLIKILRMHHFFSIFPISFHPYLKLTLYKN